MARPCARPGHLEYGLVTISPQLYVGSWFLWYSFVLLDWRVSDGVRGSVCDHVGYKSGTVLVYSYVLTGPAALYAPENILGGGERTPSGAPSLSRVHIGGRRAAGILVVSAVHRAVGNKHSQGDQMNQTSATMLEQ